MHLRVGKFVFAPGMVPTVVTLCLLPLLLGLGLWQLDRADQKAAHKAEYEARRHSVTVELLGPISDIEALRFKPIGISGRYDAAHQLLLDNQVYRGQVGYFVLTPLRIQGNDTAILVNRGWVPGGENRARLPHLPVSSGVVRVQGILNRPPAAGIRFGQADSGQQAWPRVIQRVELARIEEALGYPLARNAVILLGEHEANGFVRAWDSLALPGAFGLSPERHLGYAFQWFSLAFALIVIYVVVNTRGVRG
jgi:Uncharacterized conserved protein